MIDCSFAGCGEGQAGATPLCVRAPRCCDAAKPLAGQVSAATAGRPTRRRSRSPGRLAPPCPADGVLPSALCGCAHPVSHAPTCCCCKPDRGPRSRDGDPGGLAGAQRADGDLRMETAPLSSVQLRGASQRCCHPPGGVAWPCGPALGSPGARGHRHPEDRPRGSGAAAARGGQGGCDSDPVCMAVCGASPSICSSSSGGLASTSCVPQLQRSIGIPATACGSSDDSVSMAGACGPAQMAH